ncbi:hypothetical protein ABEP17_10785 [Priestia flexa]
MFKIKVIVTKGENFEKRVKEAQRYLCLVLLEEIKKNKMKM